ncbi:MAG: ribonuclease Z [Calditrichaeota bacterium]|nr:MAG: ribonuclease Z [Calditrichota bacterium]
MLEVITLGTGAAVPTRFRNLSSTAVVRNGDVYIYDCGEGTQIQLRRARIRPGRIKRIFISHFHGDHIFGLPGLLTSLQMAGCSQEITLYGPQGIAEFIEFHKNFCQFTLTFPLKIIEIPRSSEAEEIRDKGMVIKCQPLKHRTHTLGWAFIEDMRPGKFNAKRAQKLGVPSGPLLSKLQAGEDITLEDGRVIRSKEVVGERRPGHHVAYCIDTSPCDASVELAKGADVLVHEATFYSRNADVAEISGHSTAQEAAQIAKQAGVHHLILSHFSARTLPEDEATVLEEAKAFFPETSMAHDLERFTFDYEDK